MRFTTGNIATSAAALSRYFLDRGVAAYEHLEKLFCHPIYDNEGFIREGARVPVLIDVRKSNRNSIILRYVALIPKSELLRLDIKFGAVRNAALTLRKFGSASGYECCGVDISGNLIWKKKIEGREWSGITGELESLASGQ